MLDIALIREKSDWVKEQIIKRADDPKRVDDALAADTRRRELLVEVEALRQERNVASKAIGHVVGQLKKAEKSGDKTAVDTLTADVEKAKNRPREIGERIAAIDEELRTVEQNLRNALLWIPNIPHETVPIGAEADNIIHEPQGAALPQFDFEPKAHWELGPQIGIIDFERGAKLSGSRFYMLRGHGAALQRAIIRFMLDMHTEAHGFTELYLPWMVKSEVFEGAGQLPKFFDNIYRDAEEDFMWLGTAEIALANIHRDELLDETALPINYVAYTPCFRREKMSAGRDVRGIKRGHQFDKVEMFQYVHPDESEDRLEALKQYAINVCDALGFRYRLLDLATGDISFAMTKTYDIEVWAAGCGEWLEVSSISNAGDYQARRTNVRYRPTDGGRTQFPHTLNASGLAIPRVMIAIIENNQQADGSIVIPNVLRPYMNGLTIIPAP